MVSCSNSEKTLETKNSNDNESSITSENSNGSESNINSEYSNPETTDLTGDQPPDVMVEITGNSYETVLGTYCWSTAREGICIDTAGPVEMLEGKSPITVHPGERITFIMDYEPKPSTVSLVQFTEGGVQIEKQVENNHFYAPERYGIYYYSYGIWWMDAERENVSLGDAFYNFFIEVVPDSDPKG